jgi:hypothetical protein
MTAVEFIEDYLKFKGIIIEKENYPQVIIGVINDAKEMEKQQIINSYIEGNYKSNMDMYWKKEAANKYYCKLYKK